MKNPVGTVREEMDFSLFEWWLNQSEITGIFYQTSSWTELYFQVLYYVDVVIVQSPILLCIVYATCCLNNNGISVVSTDYYD